MLNLKITFIILNEEQVIAMFGMCFRYKESPRQGKPQIGQWTVLGKNYNLFKIYPYLFKIIEISFQTKQDINLYFPLLAGIVMEFEDKLEVISLATGVFSLQYSK